MQKLFLKHQLAAELHADPRTIERVGLMPSASDAYGAPLFDLDVVSKAWAVYKQGIAARRKK